MTKHAEEFIAATKKFLAARDQDIIDVWGGCTGFEMTKDGKVRAVGGRHERMTWGEYCTRFPDEDWD